MFKILREILTGIDGQSHDLGRYSWLMSWIGITAAAFGYWFHGKDIDLAILAAAYGGNAAAHAGALFMKRSTEPQPPEDPKS